ncbi:hypothetical protein ACVIGB_000484 [Bradyrhizobium sp. USDA 4341]
MDFARAKAAFRRNLTDQTGAAYQAIAGAYEGRGDISSLTVARMRDEIVEFRSGQVGLGVAGQ